MNLNVATLGPYAPCYWSLHIRKKKPCRVGWKHWKKGSGHRQHVLQLGKHIKHGRPMYRLHNKWQSSPEGRKRCHDPEFPSFWNCNRHHHRELGHTGLSPPRPCLEYKGLIYVQYIAHWEQNVFKPFQSSYCPLTQVLWTAAPVNTAQREWHIRLTLMFCQLIRRRKRFHFI